MKILAIDPGPQQSALVWYDGCAPVDHRICDNQDALHDIAHAGCELLVCEWIHHMGMAVGAEVFDTARWVGRFEQAAFELGHQFVLMPRRDVKLELCGQARANDANIRQALLDRWGGKEKAVGCKRDPGPLYGIKSHCWSALAVAVAYEQIRSRGVTK